MMNTLFKVAVFLLATSSELIAKVMDHPGREEVTIDRAKLLDKIKGGWAGQTIGVSFGSYTEFRHNGTFIQDYQPIPWSDGQIKKLMLEWPDLYDDIYMDLTFVDVIERYGIEAPVDSFAHAFANAGYNLWHANQAARYNILNGLKAPESGHWLNNPHADDIDFQIEADFAGLMSPGMPNAASALSDKVGHIMNYGDGWYGGVYMGAMYALAFLHDDVGFIVKEALKTIPVESSFYQCLADVIRWHDQYPDDWKKTWFEIQRKWTEEVGCPEGIFAPLDIDAKVNAAYVVLGLLYGKGDFTKTLEISTRAGQDSDCNPSSAAGVLGTIYGYNKIPDFWKKGLRDVEDMDFKYTRMSLNKVYDISYKHALEMLRKNGGVVTPTQVRIPVEPIKTVKLEQSFEGVYPIAKQSINQSISDEFSFEVEGTGFVLRGAANRNVGVAADYVFDAECYIDGKLMERAKLPTAYRTRRYELFWKYQLPTGKHQVRVRIKNPSDKHHVQAWDYIVYNERD
ncbi:MULTISPECIES: ADP-ribosylglycohydrolase family protein [Olivibacter]|jgi:hypothetical protein|uniref:ADP-ribosylglycohydrolase family protein n=1 Tax=Olivibacter oleidegradans TaxID=760123 RepID=A0ABV6HMK7_9SPHI|nr:MULTISPECIES: ADP-ribosylglycohydrolase family protein [Olivibacter]QEL02848.1 ADP-ribosylglycohydrolase family protein [Olivibacter sp. LS-1]